MTKHIPRIAIALMTFAIGFSIVEVIMLARQESRSDTGASPTGLVAPSVTSTPTPQHTPESDEPVQIEFEKVDSISLNGYAIERRSHLVKFEDMKNPAEN